MVLAKNGGAIRRSPCFRSDSTVLVGGCFHERLGIRRSSRRKAIQAIRIVDSRGDAGPGVATPTTTDDNNEEQEEKGERRGVAVSRDATKERRKSGDKRSSPGALEKSPLVERKKNLGVASFSSGRRGPRKIHTRVQRKRGESRRRRRRCRGCCHPLCVTDWFPTLPLVSSLSPFFGCTLTKMIIRRHGNGRPTASNLVR